MRGARRVHNHAEFGVIVEPQILADPLVDGC